MSYNSMDDFRNLVNKEESPSLNQGDELNEDKRRFNSLVPKSYLNLIQKDNLKEGFSDVCNSSCGKKKPYCKDSHEGKEICKNALGLNSEAQCKNAFGGKECEWEGDEWKDCTEQCKKANCPNCEGTQFTKEIDELEQKYSKTLRKYESEYKSLGDPHLSKEAGRNVANNVKQLNDKLMSLSNQLHEKTLQLKKKDKNNKKNSKNLDKKINKVLKELGKYQKETKNALMRDRLEMGEYADNELRVNYAYWHYILWLVLATIFLGGIALISFNVQLPQVFQSWPFKIVPIIVLLCLGYFIFSRIWWDFDRYLRHSGYNLPFE